MATKLTVIIPCKNEIANILGCIHSARKIADEILVADSGSTDGTLEIVRSAARGACGRARVCEFGDFKNWAIPQARQQWVMILDADERIADDLAAEINQWKRHGTGRRWLLGLPSQLFHGPPGPLQRLAERSGAAFVSPRLGSLRRETRITPKW